MWDVVQEHSFTRAQKHKYSWECMCFKLDFSLCELFRYLKDELKKRRVRLLQKPFHTLIMS